MGATKAVVFDCDGTLLRSMDVWHAMESGLARQAGIRLDPQQVEQLNANTLSQTVAFFHDRYGVGESRDELFADAFALLLAGYRERVVARAGASDLALALRSRGLLLAVASSSPRVFLEAGLERAGMLDLFDLVVSAEDEGASKRDPRFFLRLADRLGASPDAIWGIDDSVYAIRAMDEAGYSTVGIYDTDEAGTFEELRLAAHRAVREFAELPYEGLLRTVKETKVRRRSMESAESNVGILESNSFDMRRVDELDGTLRDLVERRKALGSCYRLFYQKPLHLVRGEGCRLFDADGTEYLDMYNNIPSMGHSNPYVTRAVTDQLQLINTHTRYVHENILDYAERLLKTLPDGIDRIMFMCSGSEANDLAVRCVQSYTGGEGIIVTAEAYHGNTALISGLSPSIGNEVAMSPTMRMIPTPDTYRLGTEDIGDWMCARIREQIADMRRHGIKFAGVLFDSIFSSDGVIPGKPGFLQPVVDLVHEEGGLYIADEVQPGFCRTGEAFWGFGRHGITPDVVTMGKPMANGIACSAMAIREDVLDAFAKSAPYFNTFAGNPVAMAAAQAVLRYIEDFAMLDHVRVMGDRLLAAVRQLAGDHRCLGDVRGAGLFLGVDIVRPGTTEADRETAVKLIEVLRENRVLISLCGAYGNVLKIRPPLVFGEDDLWFFIEALDASLSAVEEG